MRAPENTRRMCSLEIFESASSWLGRSIACHGASSASRNADGSPSRAKRGGRGRLVPERLRGKREKGRATKGTVRELDVAGGGTKGEKATVDGVKPIERKETSENLRGAFGAFKEPSRVANMV